MLKKHWLYYVFAHKCQFLNSCIVFWLKTTNSMRARTKKTTETHARSQVKIMFKKEWKDYILQPIPNDLLELAYKRFSNKETAFD